MEPAEMEKCALQVQKLIAADYIIISRKDFRGYICQIISSMVLLGSVTFVAVLGVIYGSTTAMVNRHLSDLESQGRKYAEKLKVLRDDWTGGQNVKLHSLEVDILSVDKELSVYEEKESKQDDKREPHDRRKHITLSAEQGRPVIVMANEGGLGSSTIEIDNTTGNIRIPNPAK